MEQVNAIVDAQNPECQGATTKPKPNPVTSAPPLKHPANDAAKAAAHAVGAKSEKAYPTTTTAKPGRTATQTAPANTSTDPPFEPGRDITADPTPKSKRGRPKKKLPDHEKELQYTLEAISLDELFERFNNLRTFADAFGSLDNWAGACQQVQQRYKQLNMATSDPGLVDSIVAALISESTVIAEKRAEMK